jgi:hypothetical protein
MVNKLEYSTETLVQLALDDPGLFLETFVKLLDPIVYATDHYGSDDYHGYLEQLETDQSFAGIYVKLVHSEGDREGGGDHSEHIWSVGFNGVPPFAFIKITGFYSSHNGTEWDDLSSAVLVYPRQVMVTQYFKDKE